MCWSSFSILLLLRFIFHLGAKDESREKAWIILIWWQDDTFWISGPWNYVIYAISWRWLKNVRQAAIRLHLSQPPLTRQIHDLEDEVGTKLFVRSQSGMCLTEAGRTFLKEARLILAQSQRAVQLAQAASRGEAGHLDIAYAGNPRTAIPPASSGINPSTHRFRPRRNPIPGIGERVGV